MTRQGTFRAGARTLPSSIQPNAPQARRGAAQPSPADDRRRAWAGGRTDRDRRRTGAAPRGDPVATPAPLPNALREPVNFLLVGVDKRPNPDDGVRSDTLILVHLDPPA